MNFQPITLNDKQLFNRYLAGRYHRLITYTFSTFYMWRDWDPTAWCLAEDALILKSDYQGIDSVLCPISPDDRAVLAATEAAIAWYRERSVPFTMSEVDEDMLNLFEQSWPGRFSAEPYEDGFNYVYLRKDLATLIGKHYHAKRNHLNRFLRLYADYQVLPLSADLVPGCLEQLDIWCERQDLHDIEIRNESCGVRDALRHSEELDAAGAVLLVGGRVAAFAIGEPLNSDTYAVHVEKADTDIDGAFAAINYFYARDFCRGYTYINRAEDMGDEGLRRAKQSYRPYKMEKKYYLRLK